LYRLGSISIEEIEAVIGVLKYTKEKHQLLLVCFQNIIPQTKTILSEAITQDLILFDKKELSVNLSNFFFENIVAHEFYLLLEI
jgi:L-threonylcarbamoyladenylate synthase